MNSIFKFNFVNGDFPTVQEIQENVENFVEKFCNGIWPEDDWYSIKETDTDINIFIDQDGVQKINLHMCRDYRTGISIPRLNTRGPVIMEKTGPGEPTKGHDASLVGKESLIQINNSVNSVFDDEYFKDIVITAVEGGIGYWSVVLDYQSENGFAKISVLDEIGLPENETHVISFEDIKTKWPRIRSKVTIHDYLDLDADDCDAIVQVLLFDEVVFG